MMHCRIFQIVCKHSIIYECVPVSASSGGSIPFTVPNPNSLANLVIYLAQAHCGAATDRSKTVYIVDKYTYVPNDQVGGPILLLLRAPG
jgi:hypothetical protein